jgi:hypothetical protein
MRASRVLFVSILGLAALPPAAPAQETVPESCPRPGYVVAGGVVPADRNGNGVVCVDPTTGDVRDDVDPPTEQHKDANQNGFVCYSAERGVVTDDHVEPKPDSAFPTSCPPGFIHYPAALFF